MQTSKKTKKNLLEEMSEMTAIAQKDLDLAKRELDEKQLLLEELAETSSKKIKEAAKTNKDLKSKVEFLQLLTNNLNDENQKLQTTNKELEIEKDRFNRMTSKLKTDLESLVLREKQLEIDRKKLIFEVEQKSQELAMASKMATVGQLSSRLVHDLRNPLTVIKNTFEILKMSKENWDPKTKERFARIEKAIKKISYQIDDVLDFVRESELHLKRIQVSEIMEDTLSDLLIPPKVKIKNDFRKVVINCDSRKLEAVFTNIITNAIQAMKDDGEIKIKIMEDGDDALVKISDTGPGIPKDVIGHMFDPLFTTKETGTGLGLSICKTIVEQHGGKIEVSSQPTLFTIRIPKNLRGFYRSSDSKLNAQN